jgi:hypothetical protein
MLETHLAGKAAEKRQNFDPSTPPACTEASPLHVEWRNQEGPWPVPDVHDQTAWEDAEHKVS